ncbi:UDP-glycosyltransferase 83A1-like isoform X2 [Magnolia sinica]|uniref:UDP-glycosyltransferase 83A1-like isoform X2 n=1 Tax=Magnolia sinica TaxID=86752 RepID=UPI00265B60BD|nr:UDP-glycosyltransferase 83A1-like isoform X2 [Magnolia sinica]
MELSHCLIDHGFKITFMNTEFIHARVMAALPKMGCVHSQIRLVSISDGMAPGEDRRQVDKLCDCFLRVMRLHLEEFIRKMNESDHDKITCVIADGSMGWAVEVAVKMGIRGVAFWTLPMSFCAYMFHVPKLIEDGIIDANGFPTKQQMIKLSPTMPALNTSHLIWLCLPDHISKPSIFRYLNKCTQAAKSADWHLCNSFYDIEPSAFELVPKILPIGPLSVGRRLGLLEGNFWLEDSSCLSWLDEQPAHSVIYIAFGSYTIFNQRQFHELALGLELSNRSFLWVVRPNLTDGSSDAYPDGFEARVANRGRIIGWSPQQKVLAHPSIACFLTHCGWNSTMEGLSNGVPFLCWPYFADQFQNQTYISHVWKVGLELKHNSSGIITREEIKGKLDELVGDNVIRARSLELQQIAQKNVTEGGASFKNFNNFIEAIKLEKC